MVREVWAVGSSEQVEGQEPKEGGREVPSRLLGELERPHLLLLSAPLPPQGTLCQHLLRRMATVKEHCCRLQALPHCWRLHCPCHLAQESAVFAHCQVPWRGPRLSHSARATAVRVRHWAGGRGEWSAADWILSLRSSGGEQNYEAPPPPEHPSPCHLQERSGGGGVLSPACGRQVRSRCYHMGARGERQVLSQSAVCQRELPYVVQATRARRAAEKDLWRERASRTLCQGRLSRRCAEENAPRRSRLRRGNRRWREQADEG
mmetsp:Transcript_14301/g.56287  ORF Transcript_14301/g.56287 Transcript_14301/m.56287 type:complete len:262 (-) Transcript_14301:394-1179(-)